MTAAWTLVSSTSRANVDLPEPETPVTATSLNSGTSIVTSLRLCKSALVTVNHEVCLLAAAGAALCSVLADAALAISAAALSLAAFCLLMGLSGSAELAFAG